MAVKKAKKSRVTKRGSDWTGYTDMTTGKQEGGGKRKPNPTVKVGIGGTRKPHKVTKIKAVPYNPKSNRATPKNTKRAPRTKYKPK